MDFKTFRSSLFTLISSIMLLAAPHLLAQQASPTIAPLNPEFVAYRAAVARGNMPARFSDGHALGYIPSPVDLSHLRPVTPNHLLLKVPPAIYDLRDISKLTAVRDQSTSGSCWAFATYASLESFLLPGETSNFSENNLKNSHGFDLHPNTGGGNYQMSTAYLTRWSGPVEESADPYNPASTSSTPGLPVVKHVQEVLFLPSRSGSTDNDTIKNAVMTYGAVFTSYYENAAYYNAANYAYYYSGGATSNHAVAIVGWDDSFDRNKFNTPAPANGAFIIRNSWGTSWGQSGYFYISYYDNKLGKDGNAVFENAEAATNYSYIYQYDPLGWISTFGYGSTVAWAANVFTALRNEQLLAVGFYTNDTNAGYQVSVYVNSTSGPTSGTLQTTTSGTLANAGFHTVTLPTPVTFATSQKFSVVVRLTNTSYTYPIVAELPQPGYSSGATASAGQSYLSSNGSIWSDLTGSAPNANVCIKAYTSVAPIVSISSPTSNERFDPSSTITIDANASSGNGAITKVEFYQGATLLNTDSEEPYSYDWASVAQGNYSLTAKAYDDQGSVTTSTAVPVIVTAAPTVSITSPLPNVRITPPQTITISANASDSDGTVAKVEFYQGTTKIGTDTASPFSYAWPNVAKGNYNLSAKAFDDQGAVTTSATVPIIVTAAPTVSITAPTANQRFNPDSTVTINATASDSDGTIASVDFYQGTTLLGSDSSSPFSYAWPNVTNGAYSLTAKAYDNQGAVTTSTAVAIVVTEVSIYPPVPNARFNPGSTITMTATAGVNGATISKVEFYQGTTLLNTDSASPYTYSWANVPKGNYSLTAKAYDSLSGEYTSAAVPIIVSAAPTVSITSPTANQRFNVSSAITINANASDSDGTIAKVDFYQGAIKLGTATTSPYSYTWDNVAKGSYSLTAKAYDDQGSVVTSTAVPIVVSQVSIYPPVANQRFDVGSTVAISATAGVNGTTISKVEFYQGATLLNTDSISPYSYSWSNVAKGNYSLTAKAYDSLAGVNTSTAVPIIVSAAPTVSISSPAANQRFNVSSTITINATATDSDGTVSKVEFFQGTTKLSTDSISPYTYSWPNVAKGTYSLTAKAYDNQGVVTTSAAVPIVVSQVSITTPKANQAFSPGSTVAISATAGVNSATISKVEFYQGTTKLSTDSSSPYSYSWPSVVKGNYSLTAKAYDSLGGINTSTAVPIIVSAVPTVSITTPTANQRYAISSTIYINATAEDSDGTVSKVEFYKDTTLLGNDTSSPYSFAWMNVAKGNYSLTAKAYDNQGAATVSAAVPIVVNALAVNITTPATNARFNPNSTITISATATSGDGTISKVEFYKGTTLLNTDSVSPYSYAWPSVPKGNYSLTAKGYDSNGAITVSAAVPIAVNTLTSAITAPAAYARFNPGATVAITATATATGANVTKVEFYQGTTLLNTDSSSPYSYSWTNVAKGNYNLTAKAYDSSGANTPSPIRPIIVSLAPTVSLSAPAANSHYDPGSEVVMAATASDSDGTIAKVDFYKGTTLLYSDTSSPYSYTWTSVPAGNYSLTAKAFDNQGAAATSAAINIAVNQLTVSIVSPTANQQFDPGSTITLSADTTNTLGTVNKVEFYRGTVLLGTDTAAPFSYDWPDVAQMTYFLNAKAYDDQGQITTSLVVPIKVTFRPTVSISAPLAGTRFDPGSTITIDADAVDSDGTISKVEFYQGTTLLNTDSTAPFSYAWPDVAEGSYTLNVIAYDNQSVSSIISAEVPIDVAPDNAPLATIFSPGVGAVYGSPAAINIIANGYGVVANIQKIEFFADGTKIDEQTFAGDEYDVTAGFVWQDVPVGTYSITIKVTDVNGSYSISDPVTVYVQSGIVNEPPSMTLVSPFPGDVVPTEGDYLATCTMWAEDTDGIVDTVNLLVDGVLFETFTTHFNGVYESLLAGIAPGPHILIAQAFDDKGAMTTDEVSIIVNIPPTITLTSPLNNAVYTAPANILLSADVADADGTIFRLEFYQNGTFVGAATSAPWEFNWTSVPEGTYTITSKVRDNTDLATWGIPATITVNP